MELQTLYFDGPGKGNTEATLRVAAERARTLGISQVVVSTNHGYTAEMAHRFFAGTGSRLIAVTISAAYAEEGWTMSPAEREKVEALGIPVVISGHALSGGVDDAVSDSAPVKFIRQAFYTMGQGVKVAVEVAIMAAEAGILAMDRECIAIAGSGEGADTALVLTPAFARDFTRLRIHEILAKPRNF